METEFETCELGEVATVRSGYAFDSKDWVEAGIPVIKIANVKDGRLVLDGCSFVTPDVAVEAQEFRLRVGDILIAMTGYIGEVALVREDRHMMLNQRVGRFAIQQSDRLDPKFLFYILRHPDVRSEVENLGYGSAQPNVSPTLIHGVEIPVPPLAEQRAIAGVLGALDDKIELNRRMNETLEAIARAEFRRMMEEGEQNNWAEDSLDNIAKFLNGLALQKFPASGDEFLPVIKIAQLRTGNTDGADRASVNIPQAYVVEDGDVLFSWSGSLEVVLWCGGRGALNQHLFKVTSDKFPKWFYYLWTKQHLPEFQAIAADKATTMGHIQRHHLSEAAVLIPPHNKMKAMDARMSPLIEKIIANNLESRTLNELRDALLPKLLSGAVRVRVSQ